MQVFKEPGVYTLTREDLKTASPDRRQRHDWRRGEFYPPGRYIVSTHTDAVRVGDRAAKFLELSVRHGRYSHQRETLMFIERDGEWTLHTTRDNDGHNRSAVQIERVKALFVALERDDSSEAFVRLVVSEHNVTLDVLIQLLENGDVSRDQIRAATDTVLRSYDAWETK